jgi:nucleotide-binding universal stress UspA family protein
MFERILVPLDGSLLSETSLPYAAAIGRVFSSKLVLLHVIERGASATVHGDRHLTKERDAASYLAETARRLAGQGIDVEVHVHGEAVESVTASLVEHSGELGSGLVVMCAHGKADLGRILRGSIAQRLLGRARVPVLLLRPERAGDGPPGALGRVLTAVDGKPEHEQGLRVAAELAARLGASLHLLMAVPTKGSLTGEVGAAGKLLPAATRELLDAMESAAAEYLAELVKGIAGRGIAVSSEICRGDPAACIAAAAPEGADGLIVLGTHGRAGTAAFWAGSVAPRIARLTRCPLLLVAEPGR